MKLSKKGEYALRTLIDLGIAAEVGGPLVQESELAAKGRIPVKFLEQIMQLLKEVVLVESQRGKFGGYRLANLADKFTVGSVVRVSDGLLAPIACVSHIDYGRCSCPEEVRCGCAC